MSSFFRFQSGTVVFTVLCAASAVAKTPRNRWMPGLSRMNPAYSGSVADADAISALVRGAGGDAPKREPVAPVSPVSF